MALDLPSDILTPFSQAAGAIWSLDLGRDKMLVELEPIVAKTESAMAPSKVATELVASAQKNGAIHPDLLATIVSLYDQGVAATTGISDAADFQQAWFPWTKAMAAAVQNYAPAAPDGLARIAAEMYFLDHGDVVPTPADIQNYVIQAATLRDTLGSHPAAFADIDISAPFDILPVRWLLEHGEDVDWDQVRAALPKFSVAAEPIRDWQSISWGGDVDGVPWSSFPWGLFQKNVPWSTYPWDRVDFEHLDLSQGATAAVIQAAHVAFGAKPAAGGGAVFSPAFGIHVEPLYVPGPTGGEAGGAKKSKVSTGLLVAGGVVLAGLFAGGAWWMTHRR